MKKLLHLCSVLIYASIAIFLIIHSDEFSVDTLLSYSPKSTLNAVLFILGLYVAKSISVIFPVIALQITSGFLFSAPLALAVNFTGALIEFTIPYFIGLYFGAGAAKSKIESNKKIADFIKKQQSHTFFVPFFLRVISCLPTDIVSMYLGAIRLPFFKYLLASFIGTLPGIIPATFMGRSITEPLSSEFIISTAITAVTAALSAIIFYVYNKRKP